MARYSTSDHCDGERFFNPAAPAVRPFADVIKWRRTSHPVPWPAVVPLASHAPPPQSVAPGQIAITYVGHASFLLRTASLAILTDPVFTTHAGPFGRLGPRRVRPPALAIDALPPIDLVLVSHNHYDHLQPSSVRRFPAATFAAPLGVARFLRHHGVGKILEFDWWDERQAGAATLTCVPAQHFSARTPWDRNRTLWCGFVVRCDGLAIYFAGDSGYGPHFADIGARVGAIDAALIPIGAYEPRWFMQPVHMNPEEAVRAHQDVHARTSIGMHFGTFRLTDEGIDEPLRALERARPAAGIAADAFRVLDFGETVVL